MGKETGISWTDHTFNPWWGCTKVSPGCDHCYANTLDDKSNAQMARASHIETASHWGKGAPRRTFGNAHWGEPLNWDRKANALGVKRRVFCASMADVMDDEAPAGERERLWKLIDATPNLMWQLLTKRPHRYVRYLPKVGFKHDNVMLGTTSESQNFYNARILELTEAAFELMMRNRERRERLIRAVYTFVSYEPALGPLSIRGHYQPDWLIFGGETGSERRPMQEQWARDVKAECEALHVAFFMKQMSAYAPAQAAKLIPADMLIRQFPEGA